MSKQKCFMRPLKSGGFYRTCEGFQDPDKRKAKKKTVEKSVKPPKKTTKKEADGGGASGGGASGTSTKNVSVKDKFEFVLKEKKDITIFLKDMRTSAVKLTRKEEDGFLNSFDGSSAPSQLLAIKGRGLFWKDTYKFPQEAIKDIMFDIYKILAKKGDVRTSTLINDTKRKIINDAKEEGMRGLRIEKVKSGDVLVNMYGRYDKVNDYKFVK